MKHDASPALFKLAADPLRRIVLHRSCTGRDCSDEYFDAKLWSKLDTPALDVLLTMPRSPHGAARTKQSRRFRAPRDTRLKGAKGVGELIRHRDITKAVDRLKDRLDEEHFLVCRPMDVWREALGVHGVVFEGDYYGAGNSPKPSRSQATMLSMRLNQAKRLLRHDDHHVSEPEALVVALKVLDMAGGNVKNAMAFMDAVVRLTAVAGGPARARMAIETAAAVKRALPARG